MPWIITQCSKCKQDLSIKNNYIGNNCSNIIMEVEPCQNPDCRDCSECEDLKIANEKIGSTENKLRSIQVIVTKKEKPNETLQIKEKPNCFGKFHSDDYTCESTNCPVRTECIKI